MGGGCGARAARSSSAPRSTSERGGGTSVDGGALPGGAAGVVVGVGSGVTSCDDVGREGIMKIAEDLNRRSAESQPPRRVRT